MMPTITIEFTPRSLAYMRAMQSAPERIVLAIGRGMKKAATIAADDIIARRLSGKGPFPAEDGRLGRVTSRLANSVGQWDKDHGAEIEGETATVSIGSNVEYAGLHEFGADLTRTSKAGTVRLATNRSGALLMRGNLATFAKKDRKLAVERKFAGGKTFKVHIPARAPIGHGIADNTVTFQREISRALRAELEGMK